MELLLCITVYKIGSDYYHNDYLILCKDFVRRYLFSDPPQVITVYIYKHSRGNFKIKRFFPDYVAWKRLPDKCYNIMYTTLSELLVKHLKKSEEMLVSVYAEKIE